MKAIGWTSGLMEQTLWAVVDIKHDITDGTFQLGAVLAGRSPGCYENIEQRLHQGEGKIRESFPDDMTNKFRLKERSGWFEA